jgi:2-methylcitrate dehydratase PrpD
MSTTEITRTLASWAAGLSRSSIPAPVWHQGLRSFVNWLGCAGASHVTVERALQALSRFSGPPKATILGRRERLDELHAALINGIASHVLDYDDTHLKTIIHPAGPVASALLAVSEAQRSSGADLLTALIIGMEVECRIGNAVYPDHYDRGWHITGTAGVFGAAAAVGHLRRLEPRRMTWAMGIAGTQSAGLREMFGTMCKSFHPGRAAQNGAAAAFLAEAGFDSSERVIEAPRGFAHVLSTKQDFAEITEGLGKRWEVGLNSYKPFACGIVIHPVIDGCCQIHRELHPSVHHIERVELRTHPLVLELTGKRDPRTGLEGKFSVYHAAAYALLRGDGSPEAFTDGSVGDPEMVALRARVTVDVDPAIREAAAHILVILSDGRRLERSVAASIGSLEKPLSDDDITDTFCRQTIPAIGADATKRLLDLAWRMDALPDAALVAQAAAQP